MFLIFILVPYESFRLLLSLKGTLKGPQKLKPNIHHEKRSQRPLFGAESDFYRNDLRGKNNNSFLTVQTVCFQPVGNRLGRVASSLGRLLCSSFSFTKIICRSCDLQIDHLVWSHHFTTEETERSRVLRKISLLVSRSARRELRSYDFQASPLSQDS